MKRIFLVLPLACAPLIAQPSAPVSPQNSITDIYDSVGAQKAGTVQDWGFSAFIKYHGKTILFDTGMDPDILALNAKALGVDLASVDVAVLSHTHNDHAAGFVHFLKVNSRASIYLPDDGRFFAATGVLPPPAHDAATALPVEEQHYGGKRPQPQMKPADMFAGRANVIAVERSIEIAPGVFIIHTNSPNTGYFDAYPPHSPEKPELDGLPELSLALKTDRGFVLVSGCSHTGVDRIVMATKEPTAERWN